MLPPEAYDPFSLFPGVDTKVVLPKKEKRRLRRERWLQSKWVLAG